MDEEKKQDFRTTRGYELIRRSKNHVTSAMEDYLEMIYRLCLEGGYTRVGLISKRLQVKPSSASKMISKLTELGYVTFDNNDGILLTGAGVEISEYLLYRHKTVEEFLSLIGASDPLKETELLEHSFSTDTVRRLDSLIRYFEEDSSRKEKLDYFL